MRGWDVVVPALFYALEPLSFREEFFSEAR